MAAINQDVIDKGFAEGERKAKEVTPDIDYKKEATEALAEARAGKAKGLGAPQYATEKKKLDRSSSRKLRAAMATAGVSGDTASQALTSMYRGSQEAASALGAAIMQVNSANFADKVAKHSYKKLALPIAYANLRLGEKKSEQMFSLAGQSGQQEKLGMIGKIFT